MDFGEILNKWEKQNVRAGAAKKNTFPMNNWLDGNDIYDKDADPAPENTDENIARGYRRSRLLRKKPDASIDLHGLNTEEAWITLETFFENSRMTGHEKVLIIHGKGNHQNSESVLRDLSKKFIESCSFAGESGYSPARDGGRGSTWVILKDADNRIYRSR